MTACPPALIHPSRPFSRPSPTPPPPPPHTQSRALLNEAALRDVFAVTRENRKAPNETPPERTHPFTAGFPWTVPCTSTGELSFSAWMAAWEYVACRGHMQ